jgi:hypothetical protein
MKFLKMSITPLKSLNSFYIFNSTTNHLLILIEEVTHHENSRIPGGSIHLWQQYTIYSYSILFIFILNNSRYHFNFRAMGNNRSGVIYN